MTRKRREQAKRRRYQVANKPIPTSLTMIGLSPGEIPRVRLTFDSAITVDQACELANQYAGIGLGVQAKRLDDQTWEFVLG